jgi:hypothetical protein
MSVVCVVIFFFLHIAHLTLNGCTDTVALTHSYPYTDKPSPGLKRTFSRDSPLSMLLGPGLGLILVRETNPSTFIIEYLTTEVQRGHK